MTVDIEELERLAAAATPGPWHRGQGPHWAREVRGSTGRGVAWCGSQGYEADAAFIAAAGEAVPALCAELRAARERIAELEARAVLLEDVADKVNDAIGAAWPSAPPSRSS